MHPRVTTLIASPRGVLRGTQRELLPANHLSRSHTSILLCRPNSTLPTSFRE